jgi:tetratricopeptide (TPR) repeat protein
VRLFLGAAMASASKAGAPPPAHDKQSLCLDILVSGHVQAYVDFFYLTHRPEVEQDAAAEAEEEQVGVPSNMLPHVKTQLEEAEVARRRGDTQAVFAAYRQLADFFTGLEDQRTAIYFWEKCLEITQLTSDVESEKQATRSLGMAHEASKDMAAAIKQYETLLDLTKATSDVGGAQQANEHLVVGYEATAASRDAAGDPHGALECREKCLEAARASGDPAKERKAHFDLGQAHEKLGGMEHLKKAVAHYESNLTLAQKADETEAQGAAAYALAQTYQRLQDGEKSLGYLKQFLRLAQASSSARAQAEACCSLGVLYNTQGDYSSAVQYLERFFELARAVGDRALVDKARTYLGIARGNSVLPQYTKVVTNDLNGLLSWKNRRTPFTSQLSIGQQ